MSKNKELSRIFYELSVMLEIEGIEWKPRAYENAARELQGMEEDVEDIYRREGKKGLKKISGIGENIALHIAEYLTSGRIKNYEQLKRRYPEGVMELTKLEGLGPRKVKMLLEELRIKTLADLEKAIQDHKISKLKGFGEKTEKNIAEAFLFYKKREQRMLLSQALPLAEEIISYLKKEAPVEAIDCVGSLRRKKETIGDIDILAASSENKKVADVFAAMPNVKKVISKGATKITVILQGGVHADLRIVPKKSYAPALQYFTGSKEHNIETRKIAQSRGFKLSEYGLFKRKTNKPEFCADEKALYKKLGLAFIPPEMRENRGEIKLASRNALPELIEPEDIKGDLHIHSNFSDGLDRIELILKKAEEIGYEYIAITDHSQALAIAGGLDRKKLEKQWAEIDRLSRKFKIKILKGAEVDILPDGSLDYPEDILKKLDIVLGAIHSKFKMSKEAMTGRIVRALANPRLHIFVHPTGRIINIRPGYKFDFNSISRAAAKYKKIFEINCNPDRLDLDDEHIRIAKKLGVKFAINTDAHTAENLRLMRYGFWQARRGWLVKEDVINAYKLEDLKKILKMR